MIRGYVPADDPVLIENPKLLQPRCVYLAGPFFRAEQIVMNELLRKACIHAGLSVFVPALDCRYTPGDPEIAADRAFHLNRYHISRSVFILADLTTPDTGTAWELGVGYATNRAMLGVVNNSKAGLNLMVRNTVNALIHVDNLAGHLSALAVTLERGTSMANAINAIGYSDWDGVQE